MIKAYDWMKPARGIFDFQKDWGEPRGVRNIFLLEIHACSNPSLYLVSKELYFPNMKYFESTISRLFSFLHFQYFSKNVKIMKVL